MRVGIKWQYFYLIEVWSLCPASSTQQIQRQNCLKEPWAGIWKTCEKQFPAEPIFVKHHVAWLVWVFLAESEARGTQPQSQTSRCEKMWNRESVFQMGEAFNWLSENQGLGTECQTHPCWHHHYWFKLHKEYWGDAKGKSWALYRFELYLNAREEKEKVLSLQKYLKVLL